MIRPFLVLAAGVALAACQPAVPDSGRGVGFDDPYTAQQRARDAALAGQPSNAPVWEPVIASESGSPAATAAETTRVLNATRPAATPPVPNTVVAPTSVATAPINASPANPQPPLLNAEGISKENNFDAVSGQRSIESDAARIASNSAQYQVVQPEALPSRREAGPNIVAFALQTRHAVGTKVYRRSFTRTAKFQRACAPFASADQAQIDFLAQGGPQKDRAGMDPDGDGFACTWDPGPYRRAAQQG